LPKCYKTRLRASLIPNIFPGVIPPDSRERGRGGEEKKKEGRGEERKEGRGRVASWRLGDGRPCVLVE